MRPALGFSIAEEVNALGSLSGFSVEGTVIFVGRNCLALGGLSHRGSPQCRCHDILLKQVGRENDRRGEYRNGGFWCQFERGGLPVANCLLPIGGGSRRRPQPSAKA